METVPARAVPADGTFMDIVGIPESKIPAYMDEVKSLGMNIVIIYATRAKSGGCDSNNYYWIPGFPEGIKTILDEAQERSMKVYVGTVASQCAEFYTEPNQQNTIADSDYVANYISQNYGSHSAFYGWYIPDEPCLACWDYPELTYSYYSGIVSQIRKYSDKPILVAPYLVGVGSRTPQEVGNRAKAFKQATGIDIQIWQDSVGGEGTNIGWSTGGFTTKDYYDAISAMIGKDSLWSDNELFNCCTVSGLAGGTYKPASISRVNRQFSLSSYDSVSKRVVWIQQHHMGTIAENHHTEALRLLSSYKALYGLGGEYITPSSYQWLTLPNPSYPDDGNEMFDLMPGNPKNFYDRSWTGIVGDAEINIDLGSSKRLDWVAFHMLNNNAAGIKFPDYLTLSCSDNGIDWVNKGTWNLPVTKEDSEYVFSNTEPLNSKCKYIKAKLGNSWWTFLGEIEIVSNPAHSDLNGDDKVDSLDFSILKSDWNSSSKPSSDINQDGAVNSVDLGIMMSQWG